MIELDLIDVVKAYAWQDNPNYVGPRIPWAELFQRLPAIIAALEDRERLRAALTFEEVPGISAYESERLACMKSTGERCGVCFGCRVVTALEGRDG